MPPGAAVEGLVSRVLHEEGLNFGQGSRPTPQGVGCIRLEGGGVGGGGGAQCQRCEALIVSRQ